MPTTLITGPVRSGKSRFAERLAREAKAHVTYVATADPRPGDPEWEARLAAHQRSRPPEWKVVESARHGRDLVEIIGTASPGSVIIVDSLGTWLAAQMSAPNMGAGDDAVALEAALGDDCRRLDVSLRSTSAQVILVSEEAGWGIVPIYPSARVFRDVLGRLHQAIAKHAERIYLVVNGFAIDLHASGVPIAAEQ